MADMIAVNQARSGAKILLDGSPYAVVENEHVKPGKGQAFNRMKLRNLLTGRVLVKTSPSGTMVESADVLEAEMQLLYSDQSGWHFMNEASYEQCNLNEIEVGDAKKWLKEGDRVTVIIWDNKPISVTPANFVELKVISCDPNAKGDTVTGGSKMAVLETKYEIRVPLFIELGDVIKIDTRSAEYVSRVSKS